MSASVGNQTACRGSIPTSEQIGAENPKLFNDGLNILLS